LTTTFSTIAPASGAVVASAFCAVAIVILLLVIFRRADYLQTNANCQLVIIVVYQNMRVSGGRPLLEHE
jgi:hypothetical protein